MNEKNIIKSEHYNRNAIRIGVVAVSILGFLCYETIQILSSISWYNNYVNEHGAETALWYTGFSSGFAYAMDRLHGDDILVGIIIGFVLLVIGLVFLFWIKTSLTVTDKRVYGTTSFGKRVDLPIDSVSAVGTSAMKGIAIGTSSGKISFKLIKNQKEIHSAISTLLSERQKAEKRPMETTVNQTIIESSNADEIKKFKDLLDSGIITQEEFDAKKKDLLGL